MITYQGLSTLEILEEAKNYNMWIAQQFLPYAKSPLLEIGSGTGNLSRLFLRRKHVTLSDVDKGLVKNLKKKFAKKFRPTIKQLDISHTVAKTHVGKYQSILAINVLEHVKSDTKAFANITQMLQKGGKLLLLVPAKKFAYTQLDKSLGHYRRYEKDTLRKKIEKAGLHIEKIYFFNIVGLISWTIRDKIERGNYMKPYQIKLFDTIVPFLKIVEQVIRPPVGISLIAIATKK